MTAKIGIIMGSASDIPVVEKGTPILEELGIEFEVAIASAHRTPAEVEAFAAGAAGRAAPVDKPEALDTLSTEDELRFHTGYGELDRVLGGTARRCRSRHHSARDRRSRQGRRS